MIGWSAATKKRCPGKPGEVNTHALGAGSVFDERLAEEGMLEPVTAVAVKRVIAWQIESETAAQKITRTAMAKKMRTCRASPNRWLDENDTSLTLTILVGATAALGRRIKLEPAAPLPNAAEFRPLTLGSMCHAWQ